MMLEVRFTKAWKEMVKSVQNGRLEVPVGDGLGEDVGTFEHLKDGAHGGRIGDPVSAADDAK